MAQKKNVQENCIIKSSKKICFFVGVFYVWDGTDDEVAALWLTAIGL